MNKIKIVLVLGRWRKLYGLTSAEK